MTTRPTDEDLHYLIAHLRDGELEWHPLDEVADALEAWLAERQAARDGVTTNEREAFEAWYARSGIENDDTSAKTAARIAWQARAKLDEANCKRED